MVVKQYGADDSVDVSADEEAEARGGIDHFLSII
jgi:hypothetical protein